MSSQSCACRGSAAFSPVGVGGVAACRWPVNDNALDVLEQGASLSSAFEQIESSRQFLEYVEAAHQALVLARSALPNESLDEPAMEAVGRVAYLSGNLLADAGRQQVGGGS